MAIEVSDIEEASAPQEESVPQEESAPSQEEPPKEEAENVAPAKRGRPPGAKDKAPRKRPRAASPEPPPPRPLTRRSSAPTASRRVRVVEEYESSEEATLPPSPRTQRHQEWTAYRQRQADTHQANVNRYASLFDRMLA